MGRVAVVTGGTRGIGAAISKALNAAGYAVAATYHGNDEAAAKFKAETGVHVYKWDVASFEACTAGLAQVTQDLGPVDILVNNAGISPVNKPITEISEAELDRVIAVNVKGLFLFSRAMVPVFRAGGGGAIINIGSTAGLRPRPGLSAYNASKGAVHTLTQTLAVELAPDKIRVCAIAPVATDTPLLPTFLGPAAGMRQKFEATVPLGRLAQPQDIANAALFLASDEAAFVTGNIVEVDGGRCV